MLNYLTYIFLMLRKLIKPCVKTGQPFIRRHIFIPCQNLQKSPSSSRWLQRHINDPYVKYAACDGYRCRSAYKLIELDDKFHFLHPGRVVIDCGACPGSWTQVAVERVVNARKGSSSSIKGLVIGIDLLDIKDIPGATLLCGHDFTSTETQAKVISLLPCTGANVILSDMAPNSTGNHSLDHEALLDLTENVLHFGIKTLADKGVFLCKLWDGRGTQDFIHTLRKTFKTVKKCKPRASRQESAEVYVYAEGFSRP